MLAVIAAVAELPVIGPPGKPPRQTAVSESGPGPYGRYGGPDGSLKLTMQGGSLRTGCASGSLSGPIRLDPRGRFSARGSYVVHRPGPQLADTLSPATPARFLGVVDQNKLRLRIEQSGAAPVLLVLERGRTPKAVRCL